MLSFAGIIALAPITIRYVVGTDRASRATVNSSTGSRRAIRGNDRLRLGYWRRTPAYSAVPPFPRGVARLHSHDARFDSRLPHPSHPESRDREFSHSLTRQINSLML